MSSSRLRRLSTADCAAAAETVRVAPAEARCPRQPRMRLPRQVALDARVLARLSIKLRAVAAGRNAGCLRAGSRRPRRVCRSARWRRIPCSARRARRGHSPRLAAALGRVRSNSLASASSVASSAGPVWLAWIMLRPKLLRSRCGAATTTSPHPNSGMSSPIRSPTSTT